jgi:hypothetical protein
MSGVRRYWGVQGRFASLCWAGCNDKGADRADWVLIMPIRNLIIWGVIALLLVGLFTAISRLRAVHSRIAPDLEAAGIPLYAQHVDAMDNATLGAAGGTISISGGGTVSSAEAMGRTSSFGAIPATATTGSRTPSAPAKISAVWAARRLSLCRISADRKPDRAATG